MFRWNFRYFLLSIIYGSYIIIWAMNLGWKWFKVLQISHLGQNLSDLYLINEELLFENTLCGILYAYFPIFKSSDSKYGPFWTWHALPIVFYWNFSSFRFLSDKNWFIYQNSKFFCLLFVLVHESASCHWSRFGSLPRTQGESRHVKVQIRIKVHLRLLLNTSLV